MRAFAFKMEFQNPFLYPCYEHMQILPIYYTIPKLSKSQLPLQGRRNMKYVVCIDKVIIYNSCSGLLYSNRIWSFDFGLAGRFIVYEFLVLFHRGHIPKRAHSKKSIFQKEHIPKRARSKKSTFQKEHIGSILSVKLTVKLTLLSFTILYYLSLFQEVLWL